MSALPRSPRRWLIPSLVALLLLAGTLSSLHVSRQNSPVWDEMHFFGIGYYLVQTGRFDIPGVGKHPPVVQYLGALPLLGQKIPLSLFGAIGKRDDRTALNLAHVDRGNALLARLGFEGFLRGRWPFIGIYALLGLFVFLWSRRVWGATAGLFSLTLYLASPALLADGFLLTNDFTFAFFLFLALYCLTLALEHPGPLALLGFVVAAALTPAVRLTGLLLAPLVGLTVLLHALRAPQLLIYLPRRGLRTVTQGRFVAYWAACGLLTCLACYLALVALYQGQWALESYRLNMRLISQLYERGHVVYLDGQRSFAGFSQYYALALLYKTPVALLLACTLALALPARWLGRRLWPPVIIATIFIGTLSLLRYSLGLRYILLVYPLFFVVAGRLLAVPATSHRPRWPQLVGAAAVVLWAFAELASVYPYPRAYTNPLFVRGPKHAYLADMDLDWGEGLIALQRYLKKHDVRHYALSYHGAVNPALFGLHPAWYENPSRMQFARRPLPSSGLVFVSSTNLSGVYGGKEYPALRRARPLAVVGGTIYVFRRSQLADPRAVLGRKQR